MSFFKSEQQQIGDELDRLYREYARLSAQMGAHAELAPYPHVADRLRTIGQSEASNASSIQDLLQKMGRRPIAGMRAVIHSGDSAWARLVSALEEYRRLLKRLSELTMRWEDGHPEEARFVLDLKDQTVRSRDAIVDLIARSDPHAIN